MIGFYVKLSLIVLFIALTYGLFGPILLSYPSDLTVWLGLILDWIAVPIAIFIFLWALLDIPKIGTWYKNYRKKF
jgi:hypothetical protein